MFLFFGFYSVLNTICLCPFFVRCYLVLLKLTLVGYLTLRAHMDLVSDNRSKKFGNDEFN